jgi:hypothetical protein
VVGNAVIHVGVQQRDPLSLAAEICGQRRDLKTILTPAQIQSVCCSEKASEFLQSNGRGSSRVTIDGKALPQVTFGIWQDTKNQDLTTLLKTVYRGATWKTYEPRYAEKAPELEEGKVDRLVKEVQAFLSTYPEDSISSQSLKKLLGQTSVPRRTWARVTKKMCHTPKISIWPDGSSFPWIINGKRFHRLTAKFYGFEEKVA